MVAFDAFAKRVTFSVLLLVASVMEHASSMFLLTIMISIVNVNYSLT